MVALGLAQAVVAPTGLAASEQAVMEDFRGQVLSFVFPQAVHNIVIRVAGPDNYYAREMF